ncbi:MAG TPA: DUF2000 domain-containing protein [Cellulomonas sp.]
MSQHLAAADHGAPAATVGSAPVGFAPDEIRTDEPTRAARLKWVVLLDSSLPPGLAANAAVCVAAATTAEVAGLLGPAVLDADGTVHPGLPWLGCTVRSGTAEQLARVRERAARSPGVHVATMPALAQQTRVYDEYTEQLGRLPGTDLSPLALSIVGPRNRVDKIVGGLPLLG